MFLLTPLADVLMHRGIVDPDSFVAPSTWSDLPSPFTLDGLEETVSRILAAIATRRQIVVFGDYDCDGVLSSAILDATLRKLGAHPEVLLPHRDDGYGLTNEAVHRFSRSGAGLLITIDNGINACVAVQLATRLGIDVVVVDHHQIETPVDVPSVWSDAYCAAGLGLMLAWGLLERFGMPYMAILPFLDGLSRLAAIASVADCVPLVGSTRILTRIGLAQLATTRHAGLRKLLSFAGVPVGTAPDAEEIAFRVAPRINAAGRVGDPHEALDMLRADSAERQKELAVGLDGLNKDRRKIEQTCMAQLSRDVGSNDKAGLVIYRAEWKKGIAGILASRAAERYHVPTFVLVDDARTGMATGSGRSVPGFSLIDALRSTGMLLVRAGGHKQASGVTLRTENIPAFREAFVDFIERHPPFPALPPVPDATLDFAWLSSGFNAQLKSLGPFGIGNPTPLFRVIRASVRPGREGFRLCRARWPGDQSAEPGSPRRTRNRSHRDEWKVRFPSKVDGRIGAWLAGAARISQSRSGANPLSMKGV